MTLSPYVNGSFHIMYSIKMKINYIIFSKMSSESDKTSSNIKMNAVHLTC